MASKNIYWRDIPASTCVTDNGATFTVGKGRSKKVVYWTGQEAKTAQKTLAARARRCAR